MGLSDAALVKDNHVMAAGGVAEAFAAVRSLAATLPVEIEVDSIEALVEALDAGADVVMLDNFAIEEMPAAVASATSARPGVVLEASGGLTLEVARSRRRDRRRLHRRRRAHPLRPRPRHRPGSRRRPRVVAVTVELEAPASTAYDESLLVDRQAAA